MPSYLQRRMEVQSLIEDSEPADLSPAEKEIADRYKIDVRYLGIGRNISYPEFRVVVLGDNTQSDARFYSFMHEVGHIESRQPPRGDADPFQVLCWEAEAWRWARREARQHGYEIPVDQIRRSISSYLENVKRV